MTGRDRDKNLRSKQRARGEERIDFSLFTTVMVVEIMRENIKYV